MSNPERRPVDWQKIGPPSEEERIRAARAAFEKVQEDTSWSKFETPVKPVEEGIRMVNEGEVNVKAKSFQEMQAENIAKLRHKIDMSGAVELGATGTDDEPFVIEPFDPGRAAKG